LDLSSNQYLEFEIMKQTKIQENCVIVLNRLAKMCEEDWDFANQLSCDLEKMLTEIHSHDGFGTEGETDPRGDFRNGSWSMRKVEPTSKSDE
jgi:hypothetical protein